MKIKELLEALPPSMQGPGAVMPNFYTASNPQQQAAWNKASTPVGYADMVRQATARPSPTNPYQGLRQQSGSPPVGPAGRGSLNLPQVPRYDLAAPSGAPTARPVGFASSPPPGAGNGLNAIRGGNSPTAIPPGSSAMGPGSLGAGSAQIDSRPERQPGQGTTDMLAARNQPPNPSSTSPAPVRPPPIPSQSNPAIASGPAGPGTQATLAAHEADMSWGDYLALIEQRFVVTIQRLADGKRFRRVFEAPSSQVAWEIADRSLGIDAPDYHIMAVTPDADQSRTPLS